MSRWSCKLISLCNVFLCPSRRFISTRFTPLRSHSLTHSVKRWMTLMWVVWGSTDRSSTAVSLPSIPYCVPGRMASAMQSDPDLICTLLQYVLIEEFIFMAVFVISQPVKDSMPEWVLEFISFGWVTVHGTLFLSDCSRWPDVGMWPFWMTQPAGKWSGLWFGWFLRIFTATL